MIFTIDHWTPDKEWLSDWAYAAPCLSPSQSLKVKVDRPLPSAFLSFSAFSITLLQWCEKSPFLLKKEIIHSSHIVSPLKGWGSRSQAPSWLACPATFPSPKKCSLKCYDEFQAYPLQRVRLPGAKRAKALTPTKTFCLERKDYCWLKKASGELSMMD